MQNSGLSESSRSQTSKQSSSEEIVERPPASTLSRRRITNQIMRANDALDSAKLPADDWSPVVRVLITYILKQKKHA